MRRLLLLLVGGALVACSGDQSARDLCDEGLCASGTLTWTVRAESLFDSSITAVAITPDEPPWFAGTWRYDLHVAERNTETFGGDDGVGIDDAFLARTGVRRLETLGAGMQAAYPLRVAGIVPDTEDGAILFAIGQQEDTRHRLEAKWVDRTGQEVVRRTLALLDAAGAFGGAAVTTDGRGWPIIAISGTTIRLDGDIHAGPRGMVFRLGQGLARETLIDVAGIDIAHIDVEGDLVAIGGTYTGAPPMPSGAPAWAECPGPEPCGFVAAFELSTSLFLWVQPIHATGGAAVHAVGIGGGQVVAMASAAGAPIEPPLGTAALPAYLIALDAAGIAGAPAVVDQTVLAEDGTEMGGRHLDVTETGRVIVALSFRGRVLVGDQPLDYSGEAGTYASVVAELGTDLLWQWELFLSNETVVLNDVAVWGDQVAIGGSYRGFFSIVSLQGVPLPTESPVEDNGFAMEIYRRLR